MTVPKDVPAEIRLARQAAVHASWARTVDRSARTEPGQRGLEARLRRDFGIPTGLPPEVDAKMLASAKQSYFTGLSAKAAKARRQRSQQAAQSAQ